MKVSNAFGGLGFLIFAIGCGGKGADENTQTEKVLGVSVKEFPFPQQDLLNFEELPEKAPALNFFVEEVKVSLPAPRRFYHQKLSVFAAKDAQGETIEAFCAFASNKSVIPDPAFVSTQENRRLSYPINFFPMNIYIGKRTDGKLKPLLFFRDIGQHNDRPHSMTLDKDGKCHLSVAEVYVIKGNRFKLYWLIGNLDTKKWEETFLIVQNDVFTGIAHSELASWRDTVHLVWNMNSKSPTSGIYYLDRKDKHFGKKVRIFPGQVNTFEMALDQDTGRILIAIPTENDGVMILSRSADGLWSKPRSLMEEFKEDVDLSLHASGQNTFILRTLGKNDRQFVIKIKDGVL